MIGGEVFGYEAHREYFVDQIVPRLRRYAPSMAGPAESRAQTATPAGSELPPHPEPRARDEFPGRHGGARLRNAGYRISLGRPRPRSSRTGERVLWSGTAAKWRTRSAKSGRSILMSAGKQPKNAFHSRSTIPAYIGAYQRAFEQDWRDLYDRCPYATPFASPEWMSGLPGELVTARRRQRTCRSGRHRRDVRSRITATCWPSMPRRRSVYGQNSPHACLTRSLQTRHSSLGRMNPRRTPHGAPSCGWTI